MGVKPMKAEKPLIDREGRLSPEVWSVYLLALRDQRDRLDLDIKRWEQRIIEYEKRSKSF